MNPGGWLLGPAATEIELHLCRWFARDVFGWARPRAVN